MRKLLGRLLSDFVRFYNFLLTSLGRLRPLVTTPENPQTDSGLHSPGPSITWLSTIPYFTLPYSTLLYFTLLYSTLLYSTLLCLTLLYSTLLYFALLYSTLLCFTLLGLLVW